MTPLASPPRPPGDDLPSDGDLVRGALAGNEDACRALVRRYERPVYNLVARLVGATAAAEDVVQESFIKMFQALDGYDQERRFAAWMFRIAHNAAIDHLRRHRPGLISLDQSGDTDSPPGVPESALADVRAESPEQAAIRGDVVAAIDTALGRLRPVYREVIVLRYQEDLSLDEIADALDLPLGTVKTFLHRARRGLADALRAAGWPVPESPGRSGP